MEMNLKTTLSAYPKLSRSILSDYVTKEELEAKNYVTHSELSEILAQYVKEVENPDPAKIYGRQKINGIMKWVPIEATPVTANQLICYGMLDSTYINASDLQGLNRAALDDTTTEYLVEYNPTSPGYFWFCSSKPISSIVAANGLTYDIEVQEQPGTVPIQVETETFNMYCYKTVSRLVALQDLAYKFYITF